jgi:hypothetical protein
MKHMYVKYKNLFKIALLHTIITKSELSQQVFRFCISEHEYEECKMTFIYIYLFFQDETGFKWLSVSVVSIPYHQTVQGSYPKLDGKGREVAIVRTYRMFVIKILTLLPINFTSTNFFFYDTIQTDLMICLKHSSKIDP